MSKAGKTYAEAIANNPGRGKNATKKRHAAFEEYKKLIDTRVRTNKVVKK